MIVLPLPRIWRRIAALGILLVPIALSLRGHVLHAHNSFHPLNLQVGEAGAARGFPVYYHPHGAMDPSLFQGWSWRALKKRLYIRFVGRLDLNRSAGVFALTGYEEAQLRSLGVTAPVAVASTARMAPASCAAFAAASMT